MRDFVPHNEGPGAPRLEDSPVQLADEDLGGYGKLLKMLVLGRDLGAEIFAIQHCMVGFFLPVGRCQCHSQGGSWASASAQEPQ